MKHQSELTGKKATPSSVGEWISDHSNTVAGATGVVGVGLGLTVATAVAAPFILGASAVCWVGATVFNAAKKPTIGNGLAVAASTCNATAVGIGVALLAGATIATGGIAVGILAGTSAIFWAASALKNWHSRRKELQAAEKSKVEIGSTSEIDNTIDNTIDNKNNNSPSNEIKARATSFLTKKTPVKPVEPKDEIDNNPSKVFHSYSRKDGTNSQEAERPRHKAYKTQTANINKEPRDDNSSKDSPPSQNPLRPQK